MGIERKKKKKKRRMSGRERGGWADLARANSKGLK